LRGQLGGRRKRFSLGRCKCGRLAGFGGCGGEWGKRLAGEGGSERGESLPGVG